MHLHDSHRLIAGHQDVWHARGPHASQDTVEAVDGVHLTQLAVGEQMSVQHFHIEPGAMVPEHSHPHEQVGYVARGTLTFMVPDADGKSPEFKDEVGYEEFVVAPETPTAFPVANRTQPETEGPNPNWQDWWADERRLSG